MSDKRLRLEILLAAIDKVTGPARNVDKALERTSRALKVNGERLRALQDQQRDISSFRAYRAQLSGLRRDLGAAQTKAQALAREHAQAEAPTRKMTRALDAARREVNRLQEAETAHVGRLNTLRDKLTAAGVSTRNLAGHERDLRREIERTTKATQAQLDAFKAREERTRRARAGVANSRQMAGDLQGAGFAAGAAGAALGAPLLGAARGAAELESSMTTIAQRSDMSARATAVFERRLLAAGRAANRNREESISLFDQLTASGIEGQNALAMSGSLGRAATAYKVGDADLAATANALRNLKVEAGDTGRMLDIMAVAGKRGNFEFDAMARSFPSLTAAAAAYRMEGARGVAELAAASQIARQGAGSDDEAATNLANLLQKIGSPETERRFAKLGINLRAGLKAGEAAGKSALETIIELTQRATGGDLSRLGQVFEDAQVQKALRPLITNLREFRSIRDEALASRGVVDQDFARRMQDAGEQAKAAKIALEDTGRTVGKILLPPLTRAAAFGGRLARGFNAWANANPGLARAIVFTAAAVAVGLVVFGGLALAVSAVLGPFALMRLAFVQAGPVFGVLARGLGLARTAMIGFNLSLLANPIVLTVAAIAAAAFLIIRYWKPISGFFAGLWRGISNAFAPVVNFISAGWNLIKAVVGLGIDYLKLYITNFTPLGIVIRNWGPISAFARGLWTGLKAVFFGGLRGIGSAIAGFSPLQSFISAFASTFSWFQNLPSRFLQFGADLMNGLTRGINRKRKEVQAAGAAAGAAAETGYRQRTQTRSPSRLFMRLGGYAMDGLALGISGGGGKAADRMRRVAGALAAAGSIGLAGPAFAVQPTFNDGPLIGAPPPGGGPGRRPPSPPMSVTINVYALPGQDVQAVADAVIKKLGGVSGNATYSDDPWEDA